MIAENNEGVSHKRKRLWVVVVTQEIKVKDQIKRLTEKTNRAFHEFSLNIFSFTIQHSDLGIQFTSSLQSPETLGLSMMIIKL